MLILTRFDVQQLLTMPAALEAVEQAFRLLAAGAVVMPQRLATPVTPYSGLHLAMPAFVGPAEEGDVGALAIKVVSVYAQNPQLHGLPMVQGALLLHDARTGALLALMDAEQITAMRTGAAAGVATRLLARPDAATLLLFGAGALAPAQVEAICAVRPIVRVLVVARTPQRAAPLCAQLAARHHLEATVVPNTPEAVAAAVAQADVITTATTSATPLFDGAALRPGTHINAVGAFRATQRELDAESVRRARVFVDSRSAAASEAGDILLAQQEHPGAGDLVAGELGEALLGKLAGRTHADEITLFKSVGLAVQDATTAARVYVAALTAGAGTQIDLTATHLTQGR